jgi:hypothetical protein
LLVRNLEFLELIWQTVKNSWLNGIDSLIIIEAISIIGSEISEIKRSLWFLGGSKKSSVIGRR